MRQSLVPVLLLATAAFSSSNVLPLLSTSQIGTLDPLSFDGQQNDNTFSNIYENTNNMLNDIFYKLSVDTPDNRQTRYRISGLNNEDADNNRDADSFSLNNKKDKYNGEGFRKEQWHNYPRQLDRLHKYLYERYNDDNRKLDPDEFGNEDDTIPDDITNEFHADSNADTYHIYDTFVTTTNPLLILKIRLAYLNDGIMNADLNQDPNLLPSELDSRNLRQSGSVEQVFINDNNPEMDVVKVKREDVKSQQDSKREENPTLERRAVTKRIFSLWSRLQSLNHKGHELHHRRNLHAFYGSPDGAGSGMLTAETRATLMRPPGSPLRWG